MPTQRKWHPIFLIVFQFPSLSLKGDVRTVFSRDLIGLWKKWHIFAPRARKRSLDFRGFFRFERAFDAVKMAQLSLDSSDDHKR